LPAGVAGRTSLVAFRTDVGVRARGGHVGASRGRFRDGPSSGYGSSINRVLSGYRARSVHGGAGRGPAWAGCCPSRPCAATRTRAGPGGIDGGGTDRAAVPRSRASWCAAVPAGSGHGCRAGSGPGRCRKAPLPIWPNWRQSCLPFKLYAISTKDGQGRAVGQNLGRRQFGHKAAGERIRRHREDLPRQPAAVAAADRAGVVPSGHAVSRSR
jgi:hypothetical protein